MDSPAETVADCGDGIDAASGSVGPLAYSDTPVLARRVRVARDEVDVKVRHFVPEHEAVDVLCALAVFNRWPRLLTSSPRAVASPSVSSPKPVTWRLGSTIR